MFARRQQVETGQDGSQVCVRVNERGSYGNGKETVDQSSVGQINASAHGRTVRGREQSKVVVAEVVEGFFQKLVLTYLARFPMSIKL